MAPSFRPQKPLSMMVVLLAFVAAGILSIFLTDSGSLMSRLGGTTANQEGRASAKQAESSLPVVKLAPESIPQEALHLKGRGMVEAGRSSELSANVSGLVEWVNPLFQTGGEIAEGDPLIRIAKQKYLADLADARADLESAILVQSEEKKEALKAVRKWDSNPKAKGDSSDLVLRLPHRRAVAARVVAAEERVKQAECLVENATVSAPYDCRVLSRQVDLGMRVSVGDPLGCVFAAKEREMRIPLSVDKVKALTRDEKGQVFSMGTVSMNSGGKEMKWNAQIVRVSSQADPRTQQVEVIASIEDNSDYLPEFRVPPVNLALNLDFQAQTTDELFWIPVASMAGDSEIWVMLKSGELAKRPVRVEQGDGDRRLVVLGNKSLGDRICLEVPPDARPGMKVRASL